MQRFYDDLTDVNGNALSGVPITVRNQSDGSLALIYSDNATTPASKSNPFNTNTQGEFDFFAQNGRYIVEVGTPVNEARPDISLFDPADTDLLSIADVVSIGPVDMKTGQHLFVDLATNAVTAVLPSNPTLNDVVRVTVVGGDVGTNNLTIDRNGQNIEGNAIDYVVTDSHLPSVYLMFADATFGWQLISAFDQRTLGAQSNPITAAERAAGVQPYTAVNAPGNIVKPWKEPLDPARYGAPVNGVDPDTVGIQTSVNVQSHMGLRTIRIPAGSYQSDNIYLYYDAVDNPGFNNASNMHGRITLEGDGFLARANLVNGPHDHGTVINFINSGCLKVSSVAAGHGSAPYPARSFIARHITFIGDNTTQVIEAAACPQFELDHVSVLQQNVAGNGVLVKSAWWGRLHRSLILTDAANSTGKGLVAGTDISAGLFLIDAGSSIESFQDLIYWESGQWNNFTIRDSSLQDAQRYSFHAAAGRINILTIQGVHLEGVSREADLKLNSVVRHLNWDSVYVLAGSTTASHLSDKCIDADQLESISARDGFVFRPSAPFLRVGNSESGLTLGRVERTSFVHDNIGAITGPIDLFEGVLPEFHEVVYTGMGFGLYDPAGLSTLRLFDPATGVPDTTKDRQTGAFSVPRLALGEVNIETGIGSTYQVAAGSNTTVYDITNTTAIACRVPNGNTQVVGRIYIIRNNAASAGLINVQNSSDSSLVVTLNPGESAMVALDLKGTGKYFQIL